MIRAIVAANVIRLRDLTFSDLTTKTARNNELARLLGSTLSQVQRICGESEQKSGISIDFLESLAEVFSCAPSDIVTPYFSPAKNAMERSHGSQPAATLQRARS